VRASLSTWQLLDGANPKDVDRAVALHLASFPPKGLIGAFAFRASPDLVTVVIVDGGDNDVLEGVAEKLAGRATRLEQQTGPAQDLIALADDGRVTLS
jgi:hypothetical protein